ncbi:MAG: YcgN family cysteine cluster protein [Deltaproteobacteria bacterium]|nr:YcgN family cysteine cluster protein [Deltaproteobacteria bacterium]
MTKDEWEALCDGCGRCCLHKVEDADTGQVYYTSVACRLLDIKTCRCRRYKERFQCMSDCLMITPDTNTDVFRCLPETCAYRLVAEGRELEWWHPLVSGDPMTVHQAVISVRDIAISEADIHPDELDEYLSTLIIELCSSVKRKPGPKR